MKHHRLTISTIVDGRRDDVELVTLDELELVPKSSARDGAFERYEFEDGYLEVRTQHVVSRRCDVVEIEIEEKDG